jgi:succinyl-CoA synthetase alpha subunit
VAAASREILSAILEGAEDWLHLPGGSPAATSIRTLEEALERQPHSNLAVISVPGGHAAREARRALEKGLHVFLFSDNVPVGDELALKEFARGKGLIVMGPDCGTAIIGGKGIGFANAVRRGPVGVIGASGTGIQEFTTLVHRLGSGISQAIGTGSRDLSDEVGGISVLTALAALESDSRTRAIAILSKPPGRRALAGLLPRIEAGAKPVVACFLGAGEWAPRENSGCRSARTLDEAAALAVELATGRPAAAAPEEGPGWEAILRKERAAMKPGQKYLRGIFAGGTFCYQAQQVLREAGVRVHSNSPLEGHRKLSDPNRSVEHTLVDMGADEFTAGRPHPMIDSSLRRERISAEARDPEVAVLLLDFILGFISSPDPAGELAGAVAAAKAGAVERGGYLSVVASVCGTGEDPQNLGEQTRILKEAGAVVLPSSARAARFCADLIHLPGGIHG